MRVTILLVIIALISFVSEAQAPRVEGESFMMTMHVGGKEIRFTVNDSDLEASPAWFHPESDSPPFAISEAIRVSRADLGQYVDDPDTWRLCGVALHTFEQRAEWFYVVEWRPDSAGYIGDGVSIPVLMNGKTLRGEIRPDARKHTGAERRN